MSVIGNPVRRLETIAILGALCASCGGEPTPDLEGDAARSTSVSEASGEGRATDGSPPPAPPSSEGRSASGEVTPSYLGGRWCFHRESRDGEAGIVEFDPDGTNRSGIYQVWAQDEYRWDVTQDLAAFRRSYPAIVDIEPDRFVGLLSGTNRVVFERAPC